jgi:hypothetical protein
MNPVISAKKAFNAFRQAFPVVLGVLLLVSLANTAIPKENYTSFFTGNLLIDSLAGAIFGSIAAGNPINSYIIGGELLQLGVSLTAVSAFILAWVTVGAIHIPAEMTVLGRNFAIARNILSFFSCIIIASLLSLTLELLGGMS